MWNELRSVGGSSALGMWLPHQEGHREKPPNLSVSSMTFLTGAFCCLCPLNVKLPIHYCVGEAPR